MAIIKSRELSKMNEKEKKEKLNELKFELIRAGVTANKTNAKTKEIKRTISRLLSSMSINKTPQQSEGELKKK